MTLLIKAQEKCKEWHKGQVRKYTSEPYHVHPFEVAKFLKDTGHSEDVQAAGLLHDTIEDCGITWAEIALEFNPNVADLVQMVTDVSKPEDGNRRTRKQLDLKHIARASVHGKSIKLADLISNSKSIAEYDPSFAKVYMREKKALLRVLQDGHPVLFAKAWTIVDGYFLDQREGRAQ